MTTLLLLFVLPSVFVLGVAVGWAVRDASAERERRRRPRFQDDREA